MGHSIAFFCDHPECNDPNRPGWEGQRIARSVEVPSGPGDIEALRAKAAAEHWLVVELRKEDGGVTFCPSHRPDVDADFLFQARKAEACQAYLPATGTSWWEGTGPQKWIGQWAPPPGEQLGPTMSIEGGELVVVRWGPALTGPRGGGTLGRFGGAFITAPGAHPVDQLRAAMEDPVFRAACQAAGIPTPDLGPDAGPSEAT